MTSETPPPDELLSAAFDGEWDGPVERSDAECELQQADWSQLSGLLKELPPESVDLVGAVRAEIDRVQPVSASTPDRWSLRTIIPGLIALTAVVLFAALPLFRTSSENEERLAKLDEMIPSLLPELEAGGWNVVVLELGEEGSPNEDLESLLEVTRQYGVDVQARHSEVIDQAEYSAGLLLQAGEQQQAVVDSLTAAVAQVEWNPAEIDGRTQEEIRQLFLQSLNSPSRSEKLFGAMYVVEDQRLQATVQGIFDSPSDASLAMEQSGSATIKVATKVQPNELVAADEAPVAGISAGRVAAEETNGAPVAMRLRKEGVGSAVQRPMIVIIRRRTSKATSPIPDQGCLLPTVSQRPSV